MNDHTQDASLDAALEPELEVALADCADDRSAFPEPFSPMAYCLPSAVNPFASSR